MAPPGRPFVGGNSHVLFDSRKVLPLPPSSSLVCCYVIMLWVVGTTAVAAGFRNVVMVILPLLLSTAILICVCSLWLSAVRV